MALQDDIPEADRLEGAPHPREVEHLFGQEVAERELLSAYARGHMHHAWIFGGQSGIGKATLAYRLARFILAHPDPAAAEVQAAASLEVSPNHPAFRQVARMAHPNLLVLRRSWVPERKVLSGEIRVADVRKVGAFFGSTAGQGGWRICIVDSADDLNINSANALLKSLEEPPSRALFLLISSAPKRLLPTIRSRCRMLQLAPLSTVDVSRSASALAAQGAAVDVTSIDAVADQAEGSFRRAMELAGGEHQELRGAVDGILATWPALDWRALHDLGDAVVREGSEGTAVLAEQVLGWLHRGAVLRAGQGPRSALAWAEAWQDAQRMVREADTFNLDAKGLVLKMFSLVGSLR